MPRVGSYSAPVDEQTIGKRLRELRAKRGLTQAQIGEQLGIDQTLVSSYERGTIRLHGALVAAFAKALRASSDEILCLKDAPNGAFRDRRFIRRLERIETLSQRKKQTLLRMIDLYLDHESPPVGRT